MEHQDTEFDLLAHNYDLMLADPLRSRFARSGEFFHRRKLEILRSQLRATGKSPADLSWLDLGCGRGDLLRLGMTQFASAFGCDVSAASLKYCHGITVREQKRADLIPFDPHSFDLITAACVYHHVVAPERLRLAQSVRNSLRPGGLFAVFEHNPWNPMTQAIVRRSPIDVNATLLYPSESVALLKEAGFIRISLYYFLLVPEAAEAKLAWMERWLRRVPFGGQYVVFGEVAG
jgi:SAM-dependent methyltransferase